MLCFREEGHLIFYKFTELKNFFLFVTVMFVMRNFGGGSNTFFLKEMIKSAVQDTHAPNMDRDSDGHLIL